MTHPSTIIIPLTTNLIDNARPLRIRVKARDKLQQDSDLLIVQLRAINNTRLVQGPLTTISEDHLNIVYEAMCEVVGMDIGGFAAKPVNS